MSAPTLPSSRPLTSVRPLLDFGAGARLGLCLALAAIAAAVMACGSEEVATAPTPTPVTGAFPTLSTTMAPATFTSTPAPDAHPKAPNFSLPSSSGGSVSLTGVLEDKRGAALVFYRGFF